MRKLYPRREVIRMPGIAPTRTNIARLYREIRQINRGVARVMWARNKEEDADAVWREYVDWPKV